MENKDFEKIIREKLEQLGAEFDPMHWEAFQRKLDTEAAPEGAARDSHPMDELISDKLRDLEVAYTPLHWAMMDEQLDAEWSTPEVDDVYLDGVAYDNLNNLNSPYNPDHWALMSKRLDEVFSLRHHVHKFKIIEAALLLFLIFNLLPYLPVSQSQHSQPSNQQSFASMAPDYANSSDANTSDKVTAEATDSTQPTTASSATHSLHSTTTSSSKAASAIAGASSDKGADQLVDKALSSGASQKKAPAALAFDEGIEIVTPLQSLTPSIQSARIPLALAIRGQVAPFDPVASKVMPLQEATLQMPLGAFHLLQPKASRIRLGMMAAFDLNYVMTPYSQQFSFPAYDRFNAGYGGGLSLGFGGAKWEVEIGILYSSISYTPEFNAEVVGTLSAGYFAEGLKAANLEVIKIPVNIHRSLGQIGKWQTSMLFGASANTALFTSYEFRKVPFTSGPGGGPPVSAPSSLGSRPEKYEGFLQGGGVLDNTYFTANLGLRIERDLSARWSVFIQPVYQHHLFSSTFGPNRDKINSGTLFLGMRANLKR